MCRNTSDPTCPRLMKHPNVEIPSIDAKITCVAVFENMFASLESHDNFLAVVVGFSGGHLQIYSVGMPLSATRLTGSWPLFAASPQDDAKTASLVVTTQSYDAAVSKIMVDICMHCEYGRQELTLSLSLKCTQSDRSNGGRKRVWCLHSDGVLTSLLPPVKPAASPVPEKVQLCFMISTDPLCSIRAFQGQTVADALGNHRICPHKWVLKVSFHRHRHYALYEARGDLYGRGRRVNAESLTLRSAVIVQTRARMSVSLLRPMVSRQLRSSETDLNIPIHSSFFFGPVRPHVC